MKIVEHAGSPSKPRRHLKVYFEADIAREKIRLYREFNTMAIIPDENLESFLPRLDRAMNRLERTAVTVT